MNLKNMFGKKKIENNYIQLQKLWDQYGNAGYEHFIEMRIGQGYAKSLEKMLLPCPGGIVFDGGCGVGAHFELILRKTKARKLIAGDYSEKMLERARHKKENLKQKDKIEVRYIDLTKKFPFLDNTFDAEIFQLSINYLPQHGWKEALKEAYRTLKPKGYLYFVGQTRDFDFSKAIPKEILREFCAHLRPNLKDFAFILWLIRGGKIIAKIGKQKSIIYPTSEEFIRYCRELSFEEIKILDKPHKDLFEGAGVAIRAKKP